MGDHRLAPAIFTHLLDGTIGIYPQTRWSALQCVEWIDANPDLLPLGTVLTTEEGAALDGTFSDATDTSDDSSFNDNSLTRILGLYETKELNGAAEEGADVNEPNIVQDDVQEHGNSRKRVHAPSFAVDLRRRGFVRAERTQEGQASCADLRRYAEFLVRAT